MLEQEAREYVAEMARTLTCLIDYTDEKRLIEREVTDCAKQMCSRETGSQITDFCKRYFNEMHEAQKSSYYAVVNNQKTFSEAIREMMFLIYRNYYLLPVVILIDNYDRPYGYNSNYNTFKPTVEMIDNSIFVEGVVVGAFASSECVKPRSLLMCV